MWRRIKLRTGTTRPEKGRIAALTQICAVSQPQADASNPALNVHDRALTHRVSTNMLNALFRPQMIAEPTQPLTQRPASASILPGHSEAWYRLAENVRFFEPDVVVLVARKMPRLVELFDLDFGPSPLVLSDLALPFAHKEVSGARVAVLDDVVNVGSTLRHASDCVRACGADEVKLFSLGRRMVGPDAPDVNCVYPEALSASTYDRVVGSVPRAISQLAKPYDLVFPVIPCRFAVPYSTAGEVIATLRERFGNEAVHILTPQYEKLGRARVTVDVPFGRTTGNYKIRLYFDSEKRTCNVVPFAIPPKLAREEFEWSNEAAQQLDGRLMRALDGAPDGASVWRGEAQCQARLFTSSLDFGLAVLNDGLGECLGISGFTPFDVDDAAMLFGPAARVVDRESSSGSRVPVKALSSVGSGKSPFLMHVGEHVSKAAKERATASGAGDDPVSLFRAIFDTLADLVGASDPSRYELQWPYRSEEISMRSYLRLRIGPTFDDLLQMMNGLVSQPANGDRNEGAGPAVRRLVSGLLDYGIDSGGVVPTLAQYEGSFYRVYRKGESAQRDLAADRVLYAWHCHGQPLSLTRFSKINATLAFSAVLKPILSPSALLRGNVATLQASCLDLGEAEIARYLRDTGRLRPSGN